VGSPEGVLKTRSLKRRPPNERWNAEGVLAIQHTPLQPNGDIPDVRLRVRHRLDPGVAEQEDEIEQLPLVPMGRPGQIRRTQLFKKDFEDNGVTPGCLGCRALARGATGSVNHSENCRARIEAVLDTTDEGKKRLEKAKARIELQHSVKRPRVGPPPQASIAAQGGPPPQASIAAQGESTIPARSPQSDSVQAAAPYGASASDPMGSHVARLGVPTPIDADVDGDAAMNDGDTTPKARYTGPLADSDDEMMMGRGLMLLSDVRDGEQGGCQRCTRLLE
jgi:hypothetical protein